jgi:hypothetical protein
LLARAEQPAGPAISGTAKIRIDRVLHFGRAVTVERRPGGGKKVWGLPADTLVLPVEQG